MFCEIVGTLPCTADLNGAVRSERQCRVCVGPIMNLEKFKEAFDRETTIKKGRCILPRYEMRFQIRKRKNLPANTEALSPTEALSLIWVPKEWLTPQTQTNEILGFATGQFATT